MQYVTYTASDHIPMVTAAESNEEAAIQRAEHEYDRSSHAMEALGGDGLLILVTACYGTDDPIVLTSKYKVTYKPVPTFTVKRIYS
jgi:hypothetical protein